MTKFEPAVSLSDSVPDQHCPQKRWVNKIFIYFGKFAINCKIVQSCEREDHMELKYIKCRLLIKKTKFYLVLSQTALSFTQRCPGQRLLYFAQARTVISFASAFSQTALSFTQRCPGQRLLDSGLFRKALSQQRKRLNTYFRSSEKGDFVELDYPDS